MPTSIRGSRVAKTHNDTNIPPPATSSPTGGMTYTGTKYHSTDFAHYYDVKHERTLIRRINNWRERQIMGKALSALAPFETVLDLPSGAGRFLPMVARFMARTLASDRSLQMLQQGMRHDALFRRPLGRFVASADRVPLPSRAVDVVFCARLIHHLATPQARVTVLAELARIARKGVVISFFDADTFKHRRRLRKLKRKGKLTNRHGVTREQMAAEAREAGLVLLKMHALLPGYAEVTAAAFKPAAD